MSRKLRWRIAGWLNRLPWTCWAEIVSWAVDGRRDQFREAVAPARACQAEGRESSCWCAKFCTADFRAEYLTKPATVAPPAGGEDQ